VGISQDEKYITSISNDGEVKIYNHETKKEIATFQAGEKGYFLL